MNRITYYCPQYVSKPKQLESALAEVSKGDALVGFHIHDEEDECGGFASPGGTVNYCWEFSPDAQDK